MNLIKPWNNDGVELDQQNEKNANGKELQLFGLNQWESGYLCLCSNKMDTDPTCKKPYTDLAHTFSVISLPLESGSGELKYCGFNGSAGVNPDILPSARNIMLY